MEDCRLILNSNSLCVICLSEVKAKLSKADLFPLHHLTSKLNSNLGDVFKDVTVPWAPNAVLDRLEVLADVCEGCGYLCEELLYKFQDDVGRENCIKLILDKMEGVKLEDKYKTCGSPAAVFYAGIVDRLRKEMIEKFRLKPELGKGSNQSATEAPAGLLGIPNLLNVPDLPMSQVCSYLTFEDIRNCSTASKGLRDLVFPSLIKSSFISFQNQSQIPAMIDFIQAISNNFKKNVNLSVTFASPDKSWRDIRSTLLKLFQDCGPHIDYLRLDCDKVWWEGDVASDLPENNCIPFLGIGNELFSNMKKLEIVNPNRRKKKNDSFIAFAKALLRNSPNLREIKLTAKRDDELPPAPSLFKLIGESGLPIDTIEIFGSEITGSEMGFLQPLNLKELNICTCFDLKDLQNWTKFWKSQSPTLRHLRFNAWHSYSLEEQFSLPRMESLETFEFDTVEGSYKEVRPILYSKLPKLKKLKVGLFDNDLSILFLSDSKPTTSVKEVMLPLPDLEKDILLRITRLFKSLSKLEIPVGSYLPHLWKDLSGLEELTLTPKSDHGKERITWIDKIITGLLLPDSYCERPSVENIQRYQQEYEEMETKMSLALLTRLKLLRLRDESLYNHTPLLLGDICCKVVLIKMKSLKCIDFCGIRPSSVGASRKVLNEMGKKIDLLFGKKRARWNY